MKAWHGGILVCVALVAAALFVIDRFNLVSAQQAVVRVDPASQEVSTRDSFNVRVMVDDVVNLGASEFTPVVIFKNPASANLWLCNKGPAICAGEGEGHLTVNEEVANIPSNEHIGGFEFVVYFSRSIVNVTVTEGPFLASTGRHTECHQEQTDNWLRFGCTSTGSEPGPTGSGILAYLTLTPNITFRPTLDNGIWVHLIDSRSETHLTDELGNPVPVDEIEDSTILLRALEGDVNYDCRVNVIDEQSEAGRYGSIFGMLTYQVLFDLEPSIPDSDIDIKDIQFVYGRDQTTCQEFPPPELTPTPTSAAGTPTPTSTSPATPGTTTPTPTLTPATTTPTVTPGGSVTPTTPTRTPPSSHHTHTPTPSSPTASPVPGATSTAIASITPSSRPQQTVSPAERTRLPGSTTSPAEVTPGEAKEFPGSGTLSTAGGPSDDDWLLAVAAALAVLGWAAIASVLRAGNRGLARSISERVRSMTRR